MDLHSAQGFISVANIYKGHMSFHILCSAPWETLGEVQPFPQPPATTFFKCLPFNSLIIMTRLATKWWKL